ncbi:perilipin-3-like isoform X2 [Carcharodon carcharias]|nr:perilipin-3-like isoform X2 [Carcharodon carcharias]
MVSAVYNSTKENHPYVKTVCDVAEQGVKTISAVAKPIIDKLEPQIAAANEYACKGLDKLEEKLPILQQSTPQVVADTKELVSSTITGAKDAVSNTVTGAKNTVTGVVDMAKGAVHGGIEKTKTVMVEGVNTVMASRVGQMVVTGVDSALNKSEEMVDHYLPMTEEELAKLASSVEGSEVAPAQKESYYVRLGSLSSKVRHRAYQHSTSKMQKARQGSQDIMVQLHNTMDLIELAKKGVDSANQKLHEVQEKLHQMWVDWQKKQKGQVEEGHLKPEQLESQTLTMTQSLTQQLQTTCLTLASNVHGLPQHIQEKMQQIRKTAETIHTSFSSASSFGDLSGQLLVQSREQMLKIRESMDGVMDYVLHNTPLNWLVGPFAPELIEHPQSEQMIEIDKVQE